METTQIVLVTLLFLIMLFLIIWKICSDGLRRTAIDLIVMAENNFAGNQQKFHAVVNGVITKLPFPFNLIPTEFIETFVQKVFNDIKIALDYGREKK